MYSNTLVYFSHKKHTNNAVRGYCAKVNIVFFKRRDSIKSNAFLCHFAQLSNVKIVRWKGK